VIKLLVHLNLPETFDFLLYDHVFELSNIICLLKDKSSKMTIRISTRTLTSATRLRRWTLEQTKSLSSTKTPVVPSIGFSGAGFLGCYHLGVAECFTNQGLLLPRGEVPEVNKPYPVLLGASAGAIVASAISAGVSAEDGMNVVLNLRHRVSSTAALAGPIWGKLPLDVFRPGFSLIDELSATMMPYMNEALNGGDMELFQRRTANGSALRIALTDKQAFIAYPNQDFTPPPPPPKDDMKYDLKYKQYKLQEISKLAKSRAQHLIKGLAPKQALLKKQNSTSSAAQTTQMPDAYCYIDSYRTIEDVQHACILSSFIPGATGPVRGVADPTNTAVRDASRAIMELVKIGAVKHGYSGRPWSPKSAKKESREESDNNTQNESSSDVGENSVLEEPFWDGGLSCIWPTIDTDTIIVCPIRADYYPNPAVHPILTLSDAPENGDLLYYGINLLPKTFPFHGKSVHIGLDNVETLVRMAFSSDEQVLQGRFNAGYSDARRFLKENDLINVFRN